ncbi:hypothetical protein [Virgibacillus subterraneus]|uniref:hypothetical protein n=1 Tax=Virgibacillus subterraneus TaxID=621109 RepID=UPI0015873FDB|nr:hypothetical protein [Virgibacillus subterraneus]
MGNQYEQCKDELLEFLMNEYGQSITRLAFTYIKEKQLAEDTAQIVLGENYAYLMLMLR